MKIRDWIAKKMLTESEWNTILMNRVGFRKPELKEKRVNIETVTSKVILDQKSYRWLHSTQGEAKYDVIYGLTRELADQLKKYVDYKEEYDPTTDNWICRVSLEVVKR